MWLPASYAPWMLPPPSAALVLHAICSLLNLCSINAQIIFDRGVFGCRKSCWIWFVVGVKWMLRRNISVAFQMVFRCPRLKGGFFTIWC